jgi:bacillithiol biosynthesis cysteine-adding enzyme BshC
MGGLYGRLFLSTWKLSKWILYFDKPGAIALNHIVAPSLKHTSAKLPASNLAFSAIPDQSKLFLEYLRDPLSLKRYYPNAVKSPDDLVGLIPEVLSKYSNDRKSLCEPLKTSNVDLGAGDKTLANIELLGRNDTVAVVTGQQAGLFTGPLYTIYKALTAIKIAETLTGLGVAAVPVFWVATEDHDLDEVSQTYVLDRDGDLAGVSCKPADVVADLPVGRVKLDSSITAAVNVLFDAVPGTEFSDALRQCIEDAWQVDGYYGTSFERELMDILGRFGLVVIDPLLDVMKELASPIYAEAIGNSEKMVSAIRHRDGELKSDGFHSQVLVEENYFPLFWHTDDGRRLAMRHAGDGRYKAKGDEREFTIDELTDIARDEPQRFSPGVMLRPVVQDYLLPTVCYVGGAAEVAYFAQNAPAYETLGRPVTSIVHRQSFTIVEAKHKRTLETYEIGFEDIFSGLETCLERVGGDLLSSDVIDGFDDAAAEINKQLDRLGRDLIAIDKTLSDSLAKRREKIVHHINALKKKAKVAQLRSDQIASRRIRDAFTALLPNGQLQERVLNVNSFLNKYGENFIDWIYDSIDPEEKEHKIIYL